MDLQIFEKSRHFPNRLPGLPPMALPPEITPPLLLGIPSSPHEIGDAGFQTAIRLNPHGPFFYYRNLGFVLWMTGWYEEAVSVFKKVIQRSPNHITVHLGLVATYIMLGREQEARAEAAEVLRIDPNFSLDRFAKVFPYRDHSVTDNLIRACRKAGLK